MYKYGKILIKKYFDEQSFVDSDIESFNNFMEKELNKIIEENKEIVPTIIPHNIEDYKIKFDKIWSVKPEITEADGSTRSIFPLEARLRKLTYSAPTYIEVSSHINGVQRESFVTQIGNIPVMLKSKFCHLNKMSRQELIEKGEDPDEPGGYFIINGTEKVLIKIEDLASNKFLIEHGTSGYIGKLFSEHGSFKIPHTMEKLKDGLFYLTFTRVKRIPIIVVIKALGILKDDEIERFISKDEQYDEIILNMVEFASIKTEEEALDYIAKKIGVTQSKEVRMERMKEILDKYLMPHIGITKEDRVFKAYNLCKMIKRFLKVSKGELKTDDKDHYMNKKLKLSGDLLADLLRLNLKVLIGDLLYNFQRIVKRGKLPSIKVIIRDKLLTQRIYSSMATGNWVSGRKGISQRIQRLNYLEMLSHLQRVVSPLSASQENFEARELHSTHLGRLCPIETPEGTNIGLRKNLSLLCSISNESNEDEVVKQLKNFGLKPVK
ncbi:MAG: DNA-directed RNA polymerase subunit B'' [Candidatus Woesearchaeota archaeon]|jgi:DNA-directed RNA polymerase beta subunit|nr:DNA-directed RNA polymerase subunit B'' [Candidatus Woesearchaeota archaeon]MDP7623251.1 DNA-directed RNA polymerase subunit B'' [Candidatus Woesearchaeota archaeon]HJN56669.1 DNA-directed RNA polymerase subunit B'' [Candidatus Woesearchaeota archaeon]|tara:strand:+ start:3737 stop:5215 length:1479 start_codon:yes stop_codon:yes gene_type:complete